MIISIVIDGKEHSGSISEVEDRIQKIIDDLRAERNELKRRVDGYISMTSGIVNLIYTR
jgi:hypothetical protein